MPRPAYPYDLTDAEWLVLEPLAPAPLPGGRPPRHPRREIVNAILYVPRTGCQWRALLWVDGGYKRRFGEWVQAELGWRVEVVQHPTAGMRYVLVVPGPEPPTLPTGFRVLKRRWAVERTFAWLGRNRRLSKDYEALPSSEEAWISVASSRRLPKRLTR